MLVIKNITVKFDKNAKPVKIKSIKVGYNNSYLTNQKKYQQLSTHHFQWNQSITLPLYYNIPLEFWCKTDETYNNPEDPNTELQCKLKIVDYKNTSQQGQIFNKANQKVATMVLSYLVLNQKLIIPQNMGYLIISSILAHFDNHYGSKGFMEISLGYKNLFTPTVKVIAGELLWSEELVLPVEDNILNKQKKQQIIFKIIIEDKLIGVGHCQIESIKKSVLKYKRIEIKDCQIQNKQIGIIFLDIQFHQKRLKQYESQRSNTVDLRQNTLSSKKNTEVLLNRKVPSQKGFQMRGNFYTQRKQNKVSSQSQKALPTITKIPISSSKNLLNIIPDKKRKKYQNDIEMFTNVFNIGQATKEESIREIFKQRRKKMGNNTSLPKLK